MDETKKKKIVIGAIIAIVVIILIAVIIAESSETGRYVGVEYGQSMAGKDGSWETVIELSSGNKFSITTTHVNSGSITYSVTGNYTISGNGDEKTIIFKCDNGTSFNGEYSTLGKKSISFIYSSKNLPTCWKQ